MIVGRVYRHKPFKCQGPRLKRDKTVWVHGMGHELDQIFH